MNFKNDLRATQDQVEIVSEKIDEVKEELTSKIQYVTRKV